jgi:16S rRNA (uracil1498-N3)-methyltransferase
MRLHRFIGDYDLRAGAFTVSDAGLVNQLKNVFRLATGDAVILCDGRGQEAQAVIEGFGKATVDFAIEEVRTVSTESPVEVTLYCAVLKRENFEWVAEKAVEGGVTALVPVLSERTVKLGLREDRLVKIMREAAEQSGRGALPQLVRTMTFKEALSDAARQDLNVIFEIGQPLFSQSAITASGAKRVGVFVGPEGGWTDEEVVAAKDKGFLVAGLGRRVLRGETAATVAVFLAATAGE